MSETLSKIIDYAGLQPGGAIAKVENYVGLNPGPANAKENLYPVLTPGPAVAKHVTYVVLTTPEITPENFGPIPIFPNLPEGFPVRLNLVMDVVVGSTKSLREVRVAQQQYPLWDIELPFYELRDETQNQVPYEPFVYPTVYQEYEELCQLWLMMYGQTNIFAFDAPWDDSRSNQFIADGDGVTFSFPVYRTWGSGALASLLPVSLVNAVFEVQVGGVTIDPTHYFIDRNKLIFEDSLGNTYPPGANEPITMTFSFYYLCRFTEDEQDFEEFAKNRWTVPNLKFRAVYWP